jgi:hypothetical protein
VATTEELYEALDAAIAAVWLDMHPEELHHFVPTHWVLCIGSQEPTGKEVMVSFIPKMDQPFYVSQGLIAHMKAKTDAQAAAGSTDD